MNAEIYQPKRGDTPNDEAVVEITKDDLPLHCPLDRMRLWDSHPRVYLPMEGKDSVRCPYCGTLFKLADDEKSV